MMVKKAPNARERFETAALALFQDRGIASTTVSDIAARADLTERTFYRYFADKREVLFWRADALQARVLDAIADAPAQKGPLATLIGALEAVGDFFDGDRARVKLRQALVAAHPDFLEREMLKLQELTLAVGAALEKRGVETPTARMVSEAGIAIARVAAERWINDGSAREFAWHIQSAHNDLRVVMMEE
jgi:AcrR family transcriptional regulator